MVKVSTPAKYETEYYTRGGKKCSMWPAGSAPVLIDLFCAGKPFAEHEAEFLKIYPGYDPCGKFDTQRKINGHINYYLKSHSLTPEKAAQLEAGRTAAKKVPGGAVDKTQNHPHTLGWHAHISSDTITIKNAPEFEDEGPEDMWRRREIAEDWEGNVNGSGKSRELKDHANELNKAGRKAKTKEKKVKTEKLKEKSRRDKI